jgi:hypothetical protein
LVGRWPRLGWYGGGRRTVVVFHPRLGNGSDCQRPAIEAKRSLQEILWDLVIGGDLHHRRTKVVAAVVGLRGDETS